MATKEDQEILRLLVQHVSRAFYESKYTIIMDQLARHPVYVSERVAFLCSMVFNGCHPVASRMMTWQEEWAYSLRSLIKSSRYCRMTR